jgi:hypothetical protein
MRNCFHVKQTVERYSMQDESYLLEWFCPSSPLGEEVPSSSSQRERAMGTQTNMEQGHRIASVASPASAAAFGGCPRRTLLWSHCIV